MSRYLFTLVTIFFFTSSCVELEKLELNLTSKGVENSYEITNHFDKDKGVYFSEIDTANHHLFIRYDTAIIKPKSILEYLQKHEYIQKQVDTLVLDSIADIDSTELESVKISVKEKEPKDKNQEEEIKQKPEQEEMKDSTITNDTLK